MKEGKKMKTRIPLILLAIVMLFSMVACNQKPTDDVTVKIYALNGTTGFGMAKMMSDNNSSTAETKPYAFTVKTDASDVTAALINGDADIAALPTNAAAALYNKSNGKIRIAAVNTLGVLYLMTNGEEIASIKDLKGKTVYCPANNPAYIFEAILKANGLEAGKDVTLQTLTEPADVQKALASGEAKIAVIPEPLASAARAANSNLKTPIDLTEEWEKAYGENTLMQGCIVVRTEWADKHPKELEQFLKDYKASIEYTNSNPKEASEMIVAAGIFAKAPIAEKAIPNCNIVYIDGDKMADALSVFFEKLHAVNPTAVGGTLPDSGIYFKK